MVPMMTIIACVITLTVTLVLPVAVLIVFAGKNKKQGIVSAWLLGAAGFFVTQILIRVPVLTALQGQNWFTGFSQNHLFLYAFALAFTAGLFELAGRFGAAKCLAKKLTWKRALAAGLGHGGIEAMLLIGMAYVNNLAYIAMINTGSFDTALVQTASMGMDVSQLEMIRTQLLEMPSAIFLLGGFERHECSGLLGGSQEETVALPAGLSGHSYLHRPDGRTFSGAASEYRIRSHLRDSHCRGSGVPSDFEGHPPPLAGRGGSL